MVHRIKIVLTVATVSLLAILALGETIAFADDDGIDAVMSPILEDYALDESNFAMGYYNTLTGESWYYNGDASMIGGSIYKLPLNMLYEEKLNAGELSLADSVAGTSLEAAMEASLVNSNNDISEKMRNELGGFETFRVLSAKYFGLDPNALTEAYRTENIYSARGAIQMLSYLNEHSEEYPVVLGLMRQAQPDTFFREKVTDYPVVHKYGAFEGALNDVGIIYTDGPFLLAVFTFHSSANVLGDIAAAMTDYTVSENAKYRQEQEIQTPQGGTGAAAPTAVPAAAVTDLPASPEPTKEPVNKTSVNRWQYVLDTIPLIFVTAYLVIHEKAKGRK